MTFRIYSKEDCIIVDYNTDGTPDIDSLDKAIDRFRETYENSPITEAITIGDRLISESFEEEVINEVHRLCDLRRTINDHTGYIGNAIHTLYHVLDYRYL